MSGVEARTGALSRRTASQRRMCLIDVARRLFADRGFHNTGMAQIASESGVLVGQIYRDFASKEDLVAAIAEQDLALTLDDSALRLAVAAQDESALRAWVAGFLQSGSRKDHSLYADILAEAQRNEKVASILQSCWERLRGQLEVALEALAPGDDRQMSRMRTAEVIMTVAGGMVHRHLSPSPCRGCGLAERVIEIVNGEIDRLIDPAVA